MPSFATVPKATPQTHPWCVRWLGTRAYWLCQAAGWSPIFALQLFTAFSKGRYAATLPILATLAGFLVSTHLYRVYLIRLRCENHSWPALIWRVLLGLVVAAVALTLLTAILSYYNNEGLAPEERFSYLSFFGIFFVLIAWLSLYFGINYYRSYQQSTIARLQLEAAVKDAELRLLRSQVDPHFLFNSLNTLRALISQNPAVARDAVTQLAEVLRTSLLSQTRYTQPLSAELEHAENYLALEKLRFESRLHFQTEITREALACHLPAMLLQTLVENAIKYGISTREAGGRIHLRAHTQDTELYLTLSNPGTLNPAGASTGLGLKNARARLAHLFGLTASLTLAQTSADEVTVTLRLPAHLQPPPITLPSP